MGSAPAGRPPAMAAAAAVDEGAPAVEDFMTETTEVHLVSRGLSEFPASLCNLPFLHFLDLSKNNITAIPAEIGYLSAL